MGVNLDLQYVKIVIKNNCPQFVPPKIDHRRVLNPCRHSEIVTVLQLYNIIEKQHFWQVLVDMSFITAVWMNLNKLRIPVSATAKPTDQYSITIGINYASVNARMLVDVGRVTKINLPLLGVHSDSRHQ